MEIMESIRAAIKELILPDLDRIREENREVKAILVLTNKRLDDVNLHLADQSRRIDEVNRRIDDTNKRIDDLDKRMDALHRELIQRTETLQSNLIQRTETLQNDLIQRTEALRIELIHRTDVLRDDLGNQIQAINVRLDRLYEVIVRRDEHQQLETRLFAMERDITELKSRVSAGYPSPRDLSTGSVAESKP
jgi:uncharacterized coiled-coil protein SlyX